MSSATAIVAGAGGELGRAVALDLADRGLTVFAVDRNPSKLEGLPSGVHPESADATDPSVIGPLVDRIVEGWGAPGVLVNTLGTFLPSPAMDTTPDQLRTMFDVNLAAALWWSQAVSRHMIEQGSGTIVHVSARPGIDPTSGMAVYGASKAALIQLTRTLDLELRPLGIRVNCIAPQLINTETNRKNLPKEMLASAVAPEALAKIIGFLTSDAAEPISGVVLPAYG
jgi:NAD(P)-dependent dehydrogenase (short-subunit alcohol dehydrogenase family)